MRHFPGSGLLFDLASQRIDAYAHKSPPLDLREYLEGYLTASGVFIGLSGHVRRRFTIQMNGRWSGDNGIIDERFRYDDGETGQRQWTMIVGDDGILTATANDIVGTAKGAQSGNAAAMRYKLRVPLKAREIVVGIDDWFYLIDDGTLINRARMSKFGLKVGEIVACFQKGKTSKKRVQQP